MTETGNLPPVPLSLYREAGDLVFLSGQLAFDDQGSIVGTTVGVQTQRVFERIGAVLKTAGLEMRDIVKTTVWLTDPEDFQPFNSAYAAAFDGIELPARSTVVAQLLVPGAKVEIEAIAMRPKS
ncbi:MAG: RidA family protein [Pseudomonadota bacterium]